MAHIHFIQPAIGLFFHVYHVPHSTQGGGSDILVEGVCCYMVNGYGLFKEAQDRKNSDCRADHVSVPLPCFIALLMLTMGILSQAAQVNNKLTTDTKNFPVSPSMRLIYRLQTFSLSLLLASALFVSL